MQGLGSFSWLIIFGALMYFMIIRPQQKQKKQRQELLDNLEKGDKIVTIGGIHGTVISIKDDTMVVQVAPNVRLTMQRSALGFVKVDDEKKNKREEEQAEEPMQIEEPDVEEGKKE